MATGGTLFEELGFYYVGPVDAHDLDNLVSKLEYMPHADTLHMEGALYHRNYTTPLNRANTRLFLLFPS